MGLNHFRAKHFGAKHFTANGGGIAAIVDAIVDYIVTFRRRRR